ncbi:hypothetical protein [Treponema pectinovorum]|uniref:hypothetical protein n=1 Tax=Treponema pectinovorum TaxID=164 RepID=UPI0011CBCDE4|nr:hypothetical protein [Treponema pectinovorum]
MTIESFIESLRKAIKEELGFSAFLLPQTAKSTTAHIDLLYQDIVQSGENCMKLIFFADFKTGGTHTKWLTKTIALRKRLNGASDSYLSVPTSAGIFRAYWISRGSPQWFYPDDESSMGAEYILPYKIEIDIPERLFTED